MPVMPPDIFAAAPATALPYIGQPWRENRSEPPDEDTRPTVLVCGTRTPDLRQVRHELTRAWRRAGQPITVCVSLWEARSPVGREAHAWTVEHRFAGHRWHPATTCPGPVTEVLTFGTPRQPAAGMDPGGGGMTLDEQQQLIRDAIDVLDARPGKWDAYLRLTLAYALSDHDDPDEGCAAEPGSECLAVATARRVLAGDA